ncbi:MAG: ABC transporter ATP-binding protein [Pseudomonadota bacterium]
MIQLENLSKSFWVRGERRVIFDGLNATIPTGASIALLGRNGAGKTTLLSIIAGAIPADHGRIVSDGTISWPVGLGGTFHPQMTGAQNTRFVARVYGVDSDALSHFVQDFSELGEQFFNPVKTYSSGMTARLGFGLSMGIKFDTYLIDETTSVGDARFFKKSRAVFIDRVQNASAIMVSHQMNTVRQFCNSGIVLHEGMLYPFADLEEAIALHQKLNG